MDVAIGIGIILAIAGVLVLIQWLIRTVVNKTINAAENKIGEKKNKKAKYKDLE